VPLQDDIPDILASADTPVTVMRVGSHVLLARCDRRPTRRSAHRRRSGSRAGAWQCSSWWRQNSWSARRCGSADLCILTWRR